MSMTKRDFIELADTIRIENKHGDAPFSEKQIEILASFCKRSNSAFKKERWISYIKGECGPNGGAR